jgi:hypothetical protein
VPTKQEIYAAIRAAYPTAANASEVGYVVLNADKTLLSIDPVAQGILKTTEERAVGWSLKAFMPPSKPISSHDIQVDGARSQYAKLGRGEGVSMGQDSEGRPKFVIAQDAEGHPIGIKINICPLVIDKQIYDVGFITLASQEVELNLEKEKSLVIAQSGRTATAGNAINLVFSTLERTINLFQGVYGNSRIGKIASMASSFGFWGIAIYTGLVIAKIAPPPDFSGDATIQNITAPAIERPPSDDVDVLNDRPSTPAKGGGKQK